MIRLQKVTKVWASSLFGFLFVGELISWFRVVSCLRMWRYRVLYQWKEKSWKNLQDVRLLPILQLILWRNSNFSWHQGKLAHVWSMTVTCALCHPNCVICVLHVIPIVLYACLTWICHMWGVCKDVKVKESHIGKMTTLQRLIRNWVTSHIAN